MSKQKPGSHDGAEKIRRQNLKQSWESQVETTRRRREEREGYHEAGWAMRMGREDGPWAHDRRSLHWAHTSNRARVDCQIIGCLSD